MLAAKNLGFAAKAVRQPPERLHKAPLPCIAVDSEGRFFILAKIDRGQPTSADEAAVSGQSSRPDDPLDPQHARLLIQRPGEPPQVPSYAAFTANWSGELIFLTSKASFAGEASRFDFTWFIPAVIKYRKLLGEVLLVSFVLQLIGLITPLFFQVVIDKVLVNHALQTLHVIAIGLLVATVFEVLLTGIRTYVFAHTSSKIDVELGARLFRHLLALPMDYFQARRVGDSVARIREMENIRSFLTGNAMTLLLDLMFSVVFIAVMLWYSRTLTFLVLACQQLGHAGEQAGHAGHHVAGATLVIDGQLTVGELIAFNMLAGQVSDPILRTAQLWNDFQQVGISMSRLGDILNTRTEVVGNKTRIPKLAGAIDFDQVSFRYRPDAPDVIRALQLKIRPGEVIGVVGRSGSGKSTLAKLVQRLHVPDRGRVLVDGQDIAIVDTASLRHEVGVVLQENVLFNRSVRDNIALSHPTLPIETIIQAAKLAGAHDFIAELPEGYDTLVGEHGTGLSGGQRQRIAIARALISNPRILIFDEATSALDYESEKIIQDNMRQICQGRTVIIIAHRLSAVRGAHRIVVMKRGQIAEIGSHAELLRNPQGIYSHLHRLQQGGAA